MGVIRLILPRFGWSHEAPFMKTGCLR